MEQLGLLVGERSRHLLGAQMNRHAQRRKRRAKLVGDGGDNIIFKLFKTAQASDVLQDYSGADNHTPGLVDGATPRQKIAIAHKRWKLHRIIKPSGRVSSLS